MIATRQLNDHFRAADRMANRLNIMAERDRLFSIVLQNDHRKWAAIRNIYKTVDTTRFTPYPVDWTRIFTPIESMAWGEIRANGLPLFPQFPIGKFFADFADPNKKIVLECDGAAYHKDKSRDNLRDSLMAVEGYQVFRVSGSDCNRVMDTPWESDSEENDPSDRINSWAKNTVDGLAWAIGVVFYGTPSRVFAGLANDVINSRRSL